MKTLGLAQFVFNGLIDKNSSRWWNTLVLPFAKRLRMLIIEIFSDPAVVYQYGQTKLFLPLSHDLPLYKKTLPNYSTNVARIAVAIERKYPTLTIIDIGANVGDTVLLLRESTQCPILCIDGDPRFFSYLKQNSEKWDDVELLQAFVGDKQEVISGQITVGSGSGHIAEDRNGKNFIELRQLRGILENHPRFAKPKLIKIDTDGYDCRILRSELVLLQKLKPVIFFEYDPYFLAKTGDAGLSIFDDLASSGYQTLMFYMNTGEYMLSVDINNIRLLEDLHHYFTGWKGHRYCDICAIHMDDSDIATSLRESEISFFQAARSLQ